MSVIACAGYSGYLPFIWLLFCTFLFSCAVRIYYGLRRAVHVHIVVVSLYHSVAARVIRFQVLKPSYEHETLELPMQDGDEDLKAV